MLHLRLGRILDLSTEQNLSLLGLSAQDVTGDDVAVCQRIGEAAHRLGFEGMLVPSATGAGSNLIVFPLNLALDSTIDEQSTETWASLDDLPGS